MTRVVIDTNVFVSSAFGGNPRHVSDLWKKGQITLCLSPAIIKEYMDVFNRLDHSLRPEVEDILRLLAGGHSLVSANNTPSLQLVKADPSDDKFIECAVALSANWIVSGDKALLGVNSYMGIRIVTPKAFLDWQRANS